MFDSCQIALVCQIRFNRYVRYFFDHLNLILTAVIQTRIKAKAHAIKLARKTTYGFCHIPRARTARNKQKLNSSWQTANLLRRKARFKYYEKKLTTFIYEFTPIAI